MPKRKWPLTVLISSACAGDIAVATNDKLEKTKIVTGANAAATGRLSMAHKTTPAGWLAGCSLEDSFRVFQPLSEAILRPPKQRDKCQAARIAGV